MGGVLDPREKRRVRDIENFGRRGFTPIRRGPGKDANREEQNFTLVNRVSPGAGRAPGSQFGAKSPNFGHFARSVGFALMPGGFALGFAKGRKRTRAHRGGGPDAGGHNDGGSSGPDGSGTR